MSLKHEFTIINQENSINNLVMNEKIEMNDDLFLYINDSFAWIETFWNKNMIKKQGMNYYGLTIIKNNGIEQLKNIINSWISLFDNAPEKIVLTGCYLIDERKNEKLVFNKDDILMQLNGIDKICDEALRQKKLILHIGI